MAYDAKCLKLSDYFLADEPPLYTAEQRKKLAQEIQACIEDFIEYEYGLMSARDEHAKDAEIDRQIDEYREGSK